MKRINRRFAAALALVVGSLGVAHAQGLVDQVVLVQDAAVANTPLPLDSNQQSGVTFTVTQAQAGSYTITVTDLALPAALSTLNVSVSSSTASVAKLSNAAGSSLSQTVTLAAGTYTVQPLATGSSQSGVQLGGSFRVAVTPQGSSQAFWQDEWAVSAASTPAPAGQSLLSDEFTVSDGGNYTLTLTDRNFPAPLASLQLVVLVHGTAQEVSGTPLSESGTVTSTQLSLPAGSYDLFIVAQANTGGTVAAGLYSLAIVGGSSGHTVAYAVTEPVGQLPAASPIQVAEPDTVSLQLNDLSYPATLASIRAVVTEGADLLAQIPASTGANPAQFQAVAGTVQLYVLAQPGSGGQGAYGAYASGSAEGTLADVAEPVVDSSHYGYAYVPSAPLDAGLYQLSINDYQLPAALGSLAAAVVQRGAVIQGSALQSTSNTANFTAQSGVATILAFPVLAKTGANSLFGVVLSSAASGAIAFNTTTGVGALFSSSSITVPSSGNYVVQATDLAFPQAMSQFAVIITSGQSVVGEIGAAGAIPVTADAGDTYVINVLAQVGGNVNYGLYGVEMAPATTMTLTASPSTVGPGQTATLTWASTNATSCTATGGWTTSQATSGTQITPALSSTTSYGMSCTGEGGTATATAKVTVAAASSSKGGGGALSRTTLLVLALALIWTLRRKRSTSASAKPNSH